MEVLIDATTTLIKTLDLEITEEINREKAAMLRRAKQEAIELLTTLKYIDNEKLR